eukprot:CAMPEP_0172011422 /NCGR_PEP_ID=MMETSP1041-20130122/8274_1 /TAXON_ID=464988 /ORGANISM="Hemiselmis andersenii, Strain CCMP439" /LENGTH=175 /DNA_ID=CAMNT_0012665887 /DNA_START=12 /DNA_END=537 /DNA_ORIENTATION=+
MRLSRVLLATCAIAAARTSLAFTAPALRHINNQLSVPAITRMGIAERRFTSSLKGQAPSELVDSAIKENKVMVFSKTWCPFCIKAKKALDSVDAKYAVMELDERDDGGEIQDVFVELTGARSVPRVFIDGKFVGGGDDVVRLANSGELAKMVKEAALCAQGCPRAPGEDAETGQG